MRKTRMFCLPFAGGTKAIYGSFSAYLDDIVEVAPLEYSGHGTRFSDPLFTSISEIVNDICTQIRASRCTDYIITGHSLGAAVAFEAAYKMTFYYLNPPKSLVLIAEIPPHLRRMDHSKSRDEIMAEIIALGHMPDEIVSNKELYNIYSEILYADIHALDNHRPSLPERTLDLPISVYAGMLDDSVYESDLRQWEKYSSKAILYRSIEGGHFFPFDNTKTFMEIFRQDLIQNLRSLELRRAHA